MSATQRLAALALALAPIVGCTAPPANPAPEPPDDPAQGRRLPADARPLPPGGVARLGIARGDTLASRTTIISAAYSGDGKTLATGTWHGAPNRKGYDLWDAETGALRGLVPSPVGGSYGVSLSADGKRLAWGGNAGDHALTGVTDTTTGEILWQTKGGNQVAFTADGRHVVAGSYGYPVVVFDAITGKLLQTLTEPDRFANSIVVSRDGKSVVASTERKRDPGAPYEPNKARVEVWDVATGRLRNVVVERGWAFGGLQRLAISSDGKAVGYTEDRTLTVVDVTTGAVRWKVENPGGIHVWEFVAFSPADDLLIAFRTVHSVRPAHTTIDLLDATTGRVVRTFEGSGYQFNRAVFSPDGRRVVTYGEGVPIRVWDVATGRALPAYDGHRAPVASVAVSDDGRTLVSVDRWYSLCVWNPPDLRHRLDLRPVGPLGLSGDGRTAVVTVSPGIVLTFDPAAGQPRVLTQDFVECVAVSRDGTLAALSRAGHGIDLAEFPGKTLRTMPGHPGAVYALAFSADGKRLLSAYRTRPQGPMMLKMRPGGEAEPPPPADDTLRVWETETGKELRRWERAAAAAALSADGKVILAGCDDGKVRRLEVDTGEELPALTLPGAITSVAVSADGLRAAAACSDGILVWEAPTGREVGRFRPDHSGVAALAFTADGRRLASAGADGTILLWDVPAGR
jgi:WD40 repeat protein